MEEQYYIDMAKQILEDKNSSDSDKKEAQKYLINMGELK